ncbi:MAG: ABC transporter permease [Candidatus Izemoplasmataceae bacterium]
MIILGISIGVSVQVFIGSLIQGLQISLVDATIGNSSQVTITREDDTEYIDDYQNITSEFLNQYEDIDVVSYAIDQPGTLIDDGETNPVLLRGFDQERSNAIYQFDEKLIEGRLPSSDNEVIVGDVLFEDMNLAIGSSYEMNVVNIGSVMVEIVGVYDFGVTAIDESWMISNLGTVQSLIGVGDVVSRIEMQVSEPFDADIIMRGLQSDLGNDFEVTNWKDQNADLLSGLNGQSVSSIMIQVFVTLSVVLGIASVLAITVLQKSRQLGILKAMGIKDKEASLIFLSEGFFLGVFGAIGGVSLGLGLSYMFTKFAVNPDGTPVIDLYIDPQFIMLSAGIAILAASLASLIPARRSSKISVIEVIKNG